MPSAPSRLSPDQSALLSRWLPGARTVRDHGWGLVETAVLEVEHEGERYIVKAGGENDHHIGREIVAHESWLQPWTSRGRAPVLVHRDAEAKIVVTRYLPGELVLGHPCQDEPETYRQAGELLAAFHAQDAVEDPEHEARENARSRAWLDGPHRIDPGSVERLRAEVASWPEPVATLVPTHGDWQPRNWLVHEGRIAIIDFGRAALRPALTDLVRLAAQDFRRNPALEEAFVEGYGSDPRDPDAWHRSRVREAIGTAAWAFRVGDESFEAQGHRMIAEVLGA